MLGRVYGLAVLGLLSLSTMAIGQSLANIGAYYFANARLSSDNTMACASCHLPERAMQDGYERALARHLVLSRNTPSLLNVNRYSAFFWDGRAKTLEDQVGEPLFGRTEMNSSDRLLLQATHACADASAGWQKSGMSLRSFVQRSLSDYMRSIATGTTKLEQYLAGKASLSPLEARGWKLFTTDLGCVSCHAMPNLTDNLFHDVGLPRRRLVLQTVTQRDRPKRYELGFDFGRLNISNQPEDIHKFRTPSLFNVMATNPYMHNGMFTTIDEVLDFYSRQRQRIGQTAIVTSDKQALLALFATLTSGPAKSPAVASCQPTPLAASAGQRHH